MDTEKKIDFYLKVLGRYDTYISLANTKASEHIRFLATLSLASTALTGWSLANVSSLCSTSTITVYHCLIIIFYIFNIFFMLHGYNKCINVIEPNITANIKSNVKKSTIFFGDVCTSENFIKKVEGMNEKETLDDLLSQVQTLAYIANEKFIHFKKVKKYTLFSFLMLLALLLVSLIIKLGYK